VTLWYRSPEILLKVPLYHTPCDAWAVGCILGEFLNLGYPMLPGRNEIDQYKLICELIGKPTPKVWPEFFELENSKHLIQLSDNKYNNIRHKFRTATDHCIDLLT